MNLKKLIELEKYSEEEEKCPNCNEYTLVGVSYKDLILMCRKCGQHFSYDEEKKEIYNIEEHKKSSN